MKFRKYNSIENTYQDKLIHKVVQFKMNDDDKWFVTEKVHGANFSVSTDGQNLRYAKRTSFLSQSDNFFNWQEIAGGLNGKIFKLYHLIKVRYKDTSKVQVFGELFGGSYPHKNVPKNNHACRVQKGVFYSPNNEFMAFDILINDKMYIYPKEAFELFKICDIPHVPVIATGQTLDEALKISNEFNTLIPNLLDFPEIDDNICEGVVIVPETGEQFMGENRIIFKNKNSKFSEKQKTKVRKQDNTLSDGEAKWQKELLGYINDNRLDNVISHEGVFDSNKQIGKFMGLLHKDVMQDFVKDHPKYLVLEKQERKRIEKIVSPTIVDLLKRRL